MHPVIHLGYALEYEQPALVAEALSMASIHEADYTGLNLFFPLSDEAAGGVGKHREKTLFQLFQEMREDKTLRESCKGPEIEHIKNVVPKAVKELVHYAGQYTVSREQIDESTLEMLDVMGKISFSRQLVRACFAKTLLVVPKLPSLQWEPISLMCTRQISSRCMPSMPWSSGHRY